MKKFFALLLCILCLMSIAAPVYATNLEDSHYTAEELQSIYETNSRMHNGQRYASYPLGSKTLSMTVIQQSNNYYCGPATACMVAKTLGLGTYTQTRMASILGTTTSGTSSNQIATGLNSLLSAASRSERYQKTDTSLSDLGESIMNSIDNDAPVVVNVKEMPNYTVSVGHFIAVNGYSYGYVGTTATNTVSICDPHYNSNYCGSFTYSLSVIEQACKSTQVDDQNKGNFCRLQ